VAAYPVSCPTATHCYVVGTLGSTAASAEQGRPLIQQDVVLTNSSGA
jgi:hypothetical protein